MSLSATLAARTPSRLEIQAPHTGTSDLEAGVGKPKQSSTVGPVSPPDTRWFFPSFRDKVNAVKNSAYDHVAKALGKVHSTTARVFEPVTSLIQAHPGKFLAASTLLMGITYEITRHMAKQNGYVDVHESTHPFSLQGITLFANNATDPTSMALCNWGCADAPSSNIESWGQKNSIGLSVAGGAFSIATAFSIFVYKRYYDPTITIPLALAEELHSLQKGKAESENITASIVKNLKESSKKVALLNSGDLVESYPSTITAIKQALIQSTKQLSRLLDKLAADVNSEAYTIAYDLLVRLERDYKIFKALESSKAEAMWVRIQRRNDTILADKKPCCTCCTTVIDKLIGKCRNTPAEDDEEPESPDDNKQVLSSERKEPSEKPKRTMQDHINAHKARMIGGRNRNGQARPLPSRPATLSPGLEKKSPDGASSQQNPLLSALPASKPATLELPPVRVQTLQAQSTQSAGSPQQRPASTQPKSPAKASVAAASASDNGSGIKFSTLESPPSNEQKKSAKPKNGARKTAAVSPADS